MVMKRGYIFFDFDGTISDAKRLTYDCFAKILDQRGYKYSKVKLKKVMGAKTPEILKSLGIENSKVNEIRKDFFKIVVKKANANNLKLCADVKPLYELKKMGYKLIVVSNSEKSFLIKSIKVLGIKGLFNKIYGADGFSTKDALLKSLLKKYHLNSKNVFYIGDRFSDVDYAHESKMKAVAIHNECSWSTRAEILKEKPDYIIKDFEDLKKLVLKNY